VDQRLRVALRLYVFGVLGLFLLVSPWTAVWQRATMALLPTALAEVVRSGWLRGMVSAIGVLDLIVALQCALELSDRLRERRTIPGGRDR
jgi:hypothetical protein